MLIRIDPERNDPVFAQIAASIRAEIAAGRVAPGDRLPTAREVATSLDVNLHTVLRAYQTLRDDGLLDVRRGRGAVVTAAAGHLTSLDQQIKALRVEAAKLGLSPDALANLVRDSQHPTHS